VNDMTISYSEQLTLLIILFSHNKKTSCFIRLNITVPLVRMEHKSQPLAEFV